MRALFVLLVLSVAAFASTSDVEFEQFVDAELVDASTFQSNAAAAAESALSDTEMEAEEVQSQTTSEQEDEESEEISEEAQVSVVEENEDEPVVRFVGVQESKADPKEAIAAASFGGLDGAKTIDLKVAGPILDKAQEVLNKVTNKINLTKLITTIKKVIDRVKLEEKGGCFLVSFLTVEETTVWDSLGLPPWLAKIISRVLYLSVCPKGGVTVRAIMQLNEWKAGFVSTTPGWLMLTVNDKLEIKITARLPVQVAMKTQTIGCIVDGEYTIPQTFELRGEFKEGALSIRAMAKELGVTLPSNLPQPINAIADTRITKIIFGYKSNKPHVVVLAESTQVLNWSKLKIDKVFIGIMWSCPDEPKASGTKLLELEGVYVSENALTSRENSKLVRMKQMYELRAERRLQSAYTKFVTSSFLEAAVRHQNKNLQCLSWALQTKITLGKIAVPLVLFNQGTGFYLTLAGEVQASHPIPDMDKDIGPIKFTVNDLALSLIGQDAWPKSLEKAITWFNGKTKIMDILCEVSRLNIQINNQVVVQMTSSATWMEKKVTVSVFYGPPDKAFKESPAYAVVLSTDIDVATILQRVLGVKIPYFISKNLYIAVASQKLELGGAQGHLTYLTPGGSTPIEAGVSFNAAVKLNPESDNAIIARLARIFNGSLTLNCAVNEQRVQVGVKLERIVFTNRVSMINTGIVVKSVYAPPSIGIDFVAGLEIKLEKQDLIFELVFGVTQTGPLTTLSLGLELKSTWKDVFGINGVVIDRPGGNVAITVANPPVVTALGIKGALAIKEVLYGAVNIGIDLINPKNDYFYGEMHKIEMCLLLKAFLGKDHQVKVPALLCEAFTWPAFIVAFSLTKQKVNLPTATLSEIKPGFFFKGKVPMPLFQIGIETQMILPPMLPEFHAKIDVPPINFPPFLVVSRAENDQQNGPLANIDVTTKLSEFNVELKAYAKIFNALGGGVSLVMGAAKGIQFNAFFIASLGGASFRTEIEAHFDPKTPLKDTGVGLKIELVDFFKLQEKVKAAIQGFATKLKETSDKLEAAAAKLGQKCLPDAMCSFECANPSSFLESSSTSQARSGANLALFQRASLLNKRLNLLVSRVNAQRRLNAQALSELIAKQEEGQGNQMLIMRSQMLLRDVSNMWRDGVYDLMEEMDQINLGIHDYHDIMEKSSVHERAEAEEKLAAEHNAAIDEFHRFAEITEDLNLDATIEEEAFGLTEGDVEVDKVDVDVENPFDGLKKLGEKIKDTAKDIGNEIKDTAKEIGHDIKDGVKELAAHIKEGVDALKNQFDKIKTKLCQGAVRVCTGACKAAQKSVEGVAGLTDLAGDGMNKLAELATLIEIKKVGFAVHVGLPTSISLELEYRFGLSKDQTWISKSFKLSTPPFEGPAFDITGLAKMIWGKVASDESKKKVADVEKSLGNVATQVTTPVAQTIQSVLPPPIQQQQQQKKSTKP